MLTKKLLEKLKEQKKECFEKKLPPIPLPVKQPNMFNQAHKTVVVLQDGYTHQDMMDEVNSLKISLPYHDDIIDQIHAEHKHLKKEDVVRVIILFWEKIRIHIFKGNVINLYNFAKFKLYPHIHDMHLTKDSEFKSAISIRYFSVSQKINDYSKIKLREMCEERYGKEYVKRISNIRDFYELSEIEYLE